MSLDAMLWATKDAPVADVEERAILAIMGESADDDGCNSHLAQKTIAKRAIVDGRTVRRRLKAMEERGLIARGDQSRVEYIPADKRPINWDLQIPYSWFNRIERTNEYRVSRGRDPLMPQDRPDLPPAPKRRQRADKGVSRSALDEDGIESDGADDLDDADIAAGLQVPPATSDERDNAAAGLQVPPASKSTTAGLQVHDGRTSSPTTQSLTQSLTQKEIPPPTERVTIEDQQPFRGGGDFSESTPESVDPMEQALDWFAWRRPDWPSQLVRQALVEAMNAKLGDLERCKRALREIAEGKHDTDGSTGSPMRLVANCPRPWFNTPPQPVAPAQRGPEHHPCSRCARRGEPRPGGCSLCAVEAAAGRAGAEASPVHPLVSASSSDAMAATARRPDGPAARAAQRLVNGAQDPQQLVSAS